jgi:hypothetical protein
LESEEGGFDLMRIQVDLGVNERARELLDAIGRTSLGQLVSEVLGVVRSQRHRMAVSETGKRELSKLAPNIR